MSCVAKACRVLRVYLCNVMGSADQIWVTWETTEKDGSHSPQKCVMR